MPQTDDELKAQVMAQTEAAIDAVLAERRKKGQLDLSDIERLAREAGQKVMQGVTAGLVAMEAGAEESKVCPECGQALIYKGKKRRDLVTDSGEVCIERRQYYCPTCWEGIFPPRSAVGSEQDEL